MRLPTASVAVLCVMLVPALGAQTAGRVQADSDRVDPGTRVRVTRVGNRPVVGQFVGANKIEVAVRTNEGVLERIPLNDIAFVQKSLGRSRRAGEASGGGMVIGALIGMLSGPKAASVPVPSREPSTCPLEPDKAPTCSYSARARFSGVGAARGAVIGLVGGAVLGAFIKTDNWRTIFVDDLPRRVSLVAPRTGARGLGLSIAF